MAAKKQTPTRRLTDDELRELDRLIEATNESLAEFEKTIDEATIYGRAVELAQRRGES